MRKSISTHVLNRSTASGHKTDDEEVSDTPTAYHANFMVIVIIGKTILAGGNYKGKADNLWGFSAHKNHL